MRKEITVIGLSHRVGKGKNEKPYDFYVLHGTSSDDATVGQSTVAISIPDHYVPDVVIGEEYILFSHYYNGRECFDDLFRQP